jgi:hypothetical protein
LVHVHHLVHLFDADQCPMAARLVFGPFNFFARALCKISPTKVLLPDPDTPVTATKIPGERDVDVF